MEHDEEIPEEDHLDPHIQRLRGLKGTVAEAWKQTLEDMDAIAADRREDGWEVLTVVAVHTDTVSIDANQHDDFGLFHIIPNNHAEEFEQLYDPAKFTEYLIYGTDVQGCMYAVTEFLDTENRRAILIANQYDMTRASGMIQSAKRNECLYTHVKTIDGTTLGIYKHDEYRPLINKPTA